MDQNLFFSDRIYLRAFEPEDVSVLHEYLNHPDLTGRRYIPGSIPNDTPLSKEQTGKILEKWGESEKQFHLAIVASGAEKVIGHTNCEWRWDPHCPFISLVIAPDYQRQGYGSDVLNMVLNYLFKHTQAHNVTGGMTEWNQAARAFALEQGFSEIGKLRRAGLRDGEYYDWIGVDILRPEWQALKGD
jgi:RimJ/RimL family protein N-acetyltransferase